jgi:hypothetical protein
VNQIETLEKKEQKLKAIVNAVFCLDLSTPTRLRSYVYARMVYCDILKELGYGSSKIGRILNVNHATIHHYWKTLHEVFRFDADLKDKYYRVREEFYNSDDPVYENNNIELKNEVISLRIKIKELSLAYSRLELDNEELKKDDKKVGNLIQMVKQRTRPNTEKEIEIKLARFYNGVYI